MTLGFTVLTSVVTAVLVGVLPAFQASAVRPQAVLKVTGVASGVRGFGRLGSRTLLVGAEVALALVLLTGAGLMLKSASRLQRTSIGVDPSNVVSALVNLPATRYTNDTGPVFQQALVERLGAVAGVDAVGWAYCMPVSGECNGTTISFPPIELEGPGPLVGIGWATAGYFDALRIPLVQGRPFTDADRAGHPKVALVDETAARTYWPGDSAVGKRIAVGQGDFGDGAQVIGVVGDVRYRTLEAAAAPHVFLPLTQSYRGMMQIVVRSTLPRAT